MAERDLSALAALMKPRWPDFDTVELDENEDGVAVVFSRKGQMVAMMHPDDYRALCKRLGRDCAPLAPLEGE